MFHLRQEIAGLFFVAAFFLLSPQLVFAEVSSEVGSELSQKKKPKQNAIAEKNAGIKAARKGQYQQALMHFLNAQKAGGNSDGLSYNLAVSYYRLGEYAQARKLFLLLLKKERSRQLAYFNLGLVANRQNKEAQAIKWFKHAYQAKGSARIRAMSKEALRRLGADLSAGLGAGLNAKQERSFNWFGYASANYLYDSNVTLANDTLTGISGVSDNALQIIGNGSGWFRGDRRNGIRFSIGTYLQKYTTLGTNDFSQLNAALGQYNKWGAWQTQVYARWEDSYFGGTNYQQAFSLDNRVRWTISRNQWLLTRYKLSRLQATNARFTYLGGWRHQARFGVLVRKKRYSLTSYYQLELNDRQDRVGTTGRFTSFSPTRHLLRSRLGLKLNAQWRMNVDGSYRYSAYRGINELSDGSRIRRIDKQYRASVSINRRLFSSWELGMRYSYTRNDSSLTLYRYGRYQISVGISGTF